MKEIQVKVYILHGPKQERINESVYYTSHIYGIFETRFVAEDFKKKEKISNGEITPVIITIRISL